MMMDNAIDVTREMLVLMLALSAPILGAALVIGLAISVLQAVTQIQEQTLTFVPKIVGMALVTVVTLPWLIGRTLEFSAKMFGPWMAG
ncbi:MAG: flagellar biosynthetic protein FliQ [Phycisphaerales bacterium JB063]